MKLILVASIALAAYLVSSALRGSMNIILSWLRLNDSYMRRNSAIVASDRAPIMIRSGLRASATAEPSFRNSRRIMSLLLEEFRCVIQWLTGHRFLTLQNFRAD